MPRRGATRDAGETRTGTKQLLGAVFRHRRRARLKLRGLEVTPHRAEVCPLRPAVSRTPQMQFHPAHRSTLVGEQTVSESNGFASYLISENPFSRCSKLGISEAQKCAFTLQKVCRFLRCGAGRSAERDLHAHLLTSMTLTSCLRISRAGEREPPARAPIARATVRTSKGSPR